MKTLLEPKSKAGGTDAGQTVVDATTRLMDAGHTDHVKLVFDIYDKAIEELTKNPECPRCFVYVALIEAMGNSADNVDIINIDQIRKELSLPAGSPNPGVQGANVDDQQTGEGEHPDIENESVDVSIYLESFRFPSK